MKTQWQPFPVAKKMILRENVYSIAMSRYANNQNEMCGIGRKLSYSNDAIEKRDYKEVIIIDDNDRSSRCVARKM